MFWKIFLFSMCLKLASISVEVDLDCCSSLGELALLVFSWLLFVVSFFEAHWPNLRLVFRGSAFFHVDFLMFGTIYLLGICFHVLLMFLSAKVANIYFVKKGFASIIVEGSLDSGEAEVDKQVVVADSFLWSLVLAFLSFAR